MQWLLCLSLLIGFVHAQEYDPVCGLPTNPAFQTGEADTPFCVVIRGDVTNANQTQELNSTQYTWFYPTVDEFTLFELHSSQELYYNDSWVRIELGNGYVSTEAQYTSNERLVTAMHGYFAVTSGNATAWVWDENADALCDDDTPALERFCSQTREECEDENSEDDLDCDLQVYLGWFGTDVNDAFLSSRDDLLSNYRQYSTADLYVAAAESAQNQIDNIPELPDLSDINIDLP